MFMLSNKVESQHSPLNAGISFHSIPAYRAARDDVQLRALAKQTVYLITCNVVKKGGRGMPSYCTPVAFTQNCSTRM